MGHSPQGGSSPDDPLADPLLTCAPAASSKVGTHPMANARGGAYPSRARAVQAAVSHPSKVYHEDANCFLPMGPELFAPIHTFCPAPSRRALWPVGPRAQCGKGPCGSRTE